MAETADTRVKMSQQLALLLTSSKELAFINKYVKSEKLDALVNKYRGLESQDVTVVNCVKHYTRLFAVLMVANRRNRDTTLNKLKLANSLSLLFTVKPLVKWVLDRCSGEALVGSNNLDRVLKSFGHIDKAVLANALTVLVSFAKYPTPLKYQRNYLSVYLSVIAAEALLRDYTGFKNFWLLFPLTFAKIWEYYNLAPEHCPKYFTRFLDFFCKDFNFISYGDYLSRKLVLLYALVPLLSAWNYRKTRIVRDWKPVVQSVRFMSVSLALTTVAQLLTLSVPQGDSTQRKRALQLIGAVSTLPSLVYRESTGVWLYAARLVLIAINRKHSTNERSKLNRFRIDKILIMASLFTLLNYKDSDALKGQKFINRLASLINRGSLI